ncbi:hypothetical protein Mal4_46250 [Maioricimonas rarisocia]|uniref:DUF1573 domain-containing protein n=1 Tax=Maioricimonas rarisocia TaxID=2528026 RepID=A0A517ZCT0_9PLAN|nr:DUF1573 domain-containing protein [Maioricimonas rarisocia]QDU40269.1 hypothetical protein Mal4_46250 [Maioricimonas rarisocia]
MQMRTVCSGVMTASLVLVCLAAQAAADDSGRELNWAEKMFSELTHDFGVVARGADVRHKIAVRNLYEETVTILDVSTTCGCTVADAPKNRVLKTGEVAWVEVAMNTQKFMRRKNSNVDVTVSFAGGASEKVRIPITAYIRSDVVLTPGSANFGSVDTGAGAERQLQISYAGRSDWTIREVKTGNPLVSAEVEEVQRSGGQVRYNLTVRLSPEAPLGAVRDQLVLVTDDEANPYVPVAVEGLVEPDIVVTPAPLPLGTLQPGVAKTFNVVVRGRKPFSIDRIECESDRDCYKVRMSNATKTVHILPLTVTPPSEPGDFEELFTLTIKGRPQPVTFTARGKITGTGT